VKLLTAAALLFGAAALGGCQYVSTGEAALKAYHDKEAELLFRAPCAMSVGGMMRMLSYEEQQRVMLNCGGHMPLSPDEIEQIQNWHGLE